MRRRLDHLAHWPRRLSSTGQTSPSDRAWTRCLRLPFPSPNFWFQVYRCSPASAKLELGTAHDECGEEVQGVGRVGGRNICDLFVDQLVGLSRDVAADEGGFEDVESDVLTGCAGIGLG